MHAPRSVRSRDVILLVLILAACTREESLVLTEVTVIDVIKGERRPGVSVVIENGKIAAIGEASAMRGRGRVIDARGKFLVPAFWDMHAHIWDPPREVPLLVANGVLGVRDVGNKPERIFRLREEIATGRRTGPHILACGPIVDGPQPTNPAMSIAVGTVSEARAAVESLQKMGADCVKVHDGLSLLAYRAIAAETKKAGLPLVGHIPVAVPTMEAAEAGQRTVEHQIGLRGASSAEDEVMRFETTHDVMAEAMNSGNFSLIPENIARKGARILDGFDEVKAAELYRAFAASGTHLDPTLVTQYALTYIDDLATRDDPRLQYIPSATRASWLPSRGMLTRYRTPSYIAYRKREWAKTLEQIPVAQRAGVRFVTGTDMSIPYVYPGFSIHDELALFVEAGLTPAEALQAATINPARLLGLERSTGSIEAGKRADLILLTRDPLEQISNTTSIAAVIVGGKLLDRAALDRLLLDAKLFAEWR